MARDEELEGSLEARYEVECAPREQKASCLAELWRRADKVLAGTTLSRQELMQALHERFLEYNRKRRREEKVMGARGLQG